MFWLGLAIGFILGILFCVAWVFVEFGLEMVKVSGRAWDWRKMWFVHAAKRELERTARSARNKTPQRRGN